MYSKMIIQCKGPKYVETNGQDINKIFEVYNIDIVPKNQESIIFKNKWYLVKEINYFYTQMPLLNPQQPEDDKNTYLTIIVWVNQF